MRRNPELAEIERAAGIIFPGAMDWMPRREIAGANGVMDWGAIDTRFAMDAEPTLVTNANAGIPAFLTTYVDPKVVQVLVTPNKAEEIYGSTMKGTWLDETAMFPMVESTGEVSSYGDYSQNGRASANVQFENRQAYLYQVFTEWGERELERMGLGKVDWAARLNIASAMVIDKFDNQAAFYGVANLQQYGALNDPSLPAALTPLAKANTTYGVTWRLAQPQEMLADVQYMFTQLQLQTGSNLELDAPLTLALHSVSEVYLANTNQFGLNGYEMLKKVFPNLKIKQAPQFLSGTTYSCQLFVDELEGQRTVETARNCKMRAHAVIQAESSWRQKKTAGTWGAIWYFPAGCASMTGI